MVSTALIWPAVLAGFLLFVATWWEPESSVARKAYFVTLIPVIIRYAIWRWRDTLPLFAWNAECAALYGFYLLELLSLLLFIRTRAPLLGMLIRSAEADRNVAWHQRLPAPPLVDVFVPTYNEKWEVLERTFAGLHRLRYPRVRFWILDDGNRSWLAETCEKHGFNYVRRENNAHFKAGNLNNGLEHVFASGEAPDFLAVFDADFVPQPNFLERTLALMHEERVGIVQTPQTFYNPDPFQYSFLAEDKWPDEQRFMFDIRLPSGDAQGKAMCCGTSFLLRIEALRAIGGRFPTESICEDTMTSMKLRKAGWQTVYLMERLSSGLNAEGLGEFLKQRSRWCLGGVQISQWTLRAARKLSGKVLSIESMLKWAYMSCMQMLWLALPISYWWTGFSLMHARPVAILDYIVPISILRVYASWFTRRTQIPIVTDAFTLMLGPVAVKSTLAGLMPNREYVFRVTNKGISQTRVIVHWRILLVASTVFVLLVGGMIYRLFIAGLAGASGHSAWNYYATCQQALVLLIVMLVAVERPRRRIAERYRTNEAVGVVAGEQTLVGRLLDLSVGGARIQTLEPLRTGSAVALDIDGVGTVEGVVLRKPRQNEYGIRFAPESRRDSLLGRIYCTPLCMGQQTWSGASSLLAIFPRLVEVVMSGLARATTVTWSFAKPATQHSEAE